MDDPSQQLASSEEEDDRERRNSNEVDGTNNDSEAAAPKKRKRTDENDEDSGAEDAGTPAPKKRKVDASESEAKDVQKKKGISPKKEDDSDEEEECCVCLQSYSLPHKISCGHTFCFLCIKEIINRLSPTCPLCRRAVPKADIENAKMSVKDFESHDRVFQWEYSGRKGGWWAYEEAAMLQIEEYCLHWVKGKVTAGGPAVPPAPVAPSVPAMAPPAVVPDLSKCYEIEVGTRIYLIDFDNMIQFPKGFPNRQRKLRRKAKLLRSGSLKGQAGLFFDKK